MSRYLGPKFKKSRSLKYPFLGGREFIKGKKRTTSPGIHGQGEGKIKKNYSVYFTQNQAKQRLRFSYGLLEKQLYNSFSKIKKERKGNIGHSLLIKCESRLDSIIKRSGITPTIHCARQWVSHGHFLVDGKKTKTPSYSVRPGQVISFKKETLSNSSLVQESLKCNRPVPSFLEFNKNKMTILCVREPSMEDKEIQEIETAINTSLITEWYNRKI